MITLSAPARRSGGSVSADTRSRQTASPLRDGESTGSGNHHAGRRVYPKFVPSRRNSLCVPFELGIPRMAVVPGPLAAITPHAASLRGANPSLPTHGPTRHDACSPPAGGCRWVSVDHGRTSPAGQVSGHHEVDEQRQRAGDGGELLWCVAAPRADRPLLDRSLEAVHRLALLAGRSPSSTGVHESAAGRAAPCRNGLRGLMRAGHSGKGRGAPLPEQGLQLRRRGALPLEHPQR